MPDRGRGIGRLVIALGLFGAAPGWTDGTDVSAMLDEALGPLVGLLEHVEGARIVAVSPFEYGEGIGVKNAEEKAAWHLARTGKFRVADRRALRLFLEEQKLALSGLTDSKDLEKAGKLLQVDAFLFGKVALSGDRLVVNLELRDVATGAVLWNDELWGEHPSKVSLGLGIRLGTFNASSRTYLSVAGSKGFENPQEKLQAVGVAFLGHMVQRLAVSRGLSFGADAIFSRGDWQLAPFEDTVLGGGSTLFQKSAYKDYNLTLIPVIRIHPAYLWGWRRDLLVLYGGAGLSTDYVSLEGTFRVRKADGSFDTQEIAYSRVNLNPGNIAWKAGAEARFTDHFSMFVEAYGLPSMTMKFEDVHSAITPEVTVAGGTYYGFGAKFYFMNF